MNIPPPSCGQLQKESQLIPEFDPTVPPPQVLPPYNSYPHSYNYSTTLGVNSGLPSYFPDTSYPSFTEQTYPPRYSVPPPTNVAGTQSYVSFTPNYFPSTTSIPSHSVPYYTQSQCPYQTSVDPSSSLQESTTCPYNYYQQTGYQQPAPSKENEDAKIERKSENDRYKRSSTSTSKSSGFDQERRGRTRHQSSFSKVHSDSMHSRKSLSPRRSYTSSTRDSLPLYAHNSDYSSHDRRKYLPRSSSRSTPPGRHSSRDRESEHPTKKRETERDRLLRNWRSQYCETSEEIAKKLAELSESEEKEVWVRSSPAELFYRRTNNGNEVESTPRLDALCNLFEEQLVKRGEKVKSTQEPYNPPKQKRRTRLCRHKCKLFNLKEGEVV